MHETDTTAQDFIGVVRSFGSDADDVRDAAHEATHALMAGVRLGRWDRETIHRALERMAGRDLGRFVRFEIEARAVEQIVSKAFYYDCGPIEHWANTAWWETMKNSNITLPPGDWLARQIQSAMRRTYVREIARAVASLAHCKMKVRPV